MKDDPLQSVYSYVERAYVRLQAGDLLIRCLEEGSALPVQQLVEALVLAGPQSIQTLREILAEASQRKRQVQEDLRQLYLDLEKSLRSYGLHLDDQMPASALTGLSEDELRQFLQRQQILEPPVQAACKQILDDSQDLVENLSSRLDLLTEIEAQLQDWLWGLGYQSAHQSPNPQASQQPLIKQ